MIKKILDQRADPWVYLHSDGFYYFTASVPEYDRIEIKKSSTLEGLKDAETAVVWKKHESGPMSFHIWAPEIHFIDGKWYIYFASSEKNDIWKLRPFVLECSGADPLHSEWNEKGPFLTSSDDPYSFTDFSLDLTTFTQKGKRYAVWAQKTGGQMGISNLYLAEMDTPWSLSTIPVLLSTPDYHWERHGFWVNEGPAVLKRNNRVYIAFSASATDHHYCMGMLYADDSSDLHDPGSWTKCNLPIKSTDPESGVFGPGHNCFTQDKSGNDLWVFHGRPYKEITGDPLYDPNRHTWIAPVKWNNINLPII